MPSCPASWLFCVIADSLIFRLESKLVTSRAYVQDLCTVYRKVLLQYEDAHPEDPFSAMAWPLSQVEMTSRLLQQYCTCPAQEQLWHTTSRWPPKARPLQLRSNKQ